MRIILVLSLLLLLCFSSKAQFSPADSNNVTVVVGTGQAGNYYFAANGVDTNPCSQASPCLTLAKAASLTYLPGSTINFRGGGTFTGCWILSAANVTNGGDVNSPVIIQSYGTGQATWSSSCTGNGVPLFDIAGVKGVTVQNIKMVVGTGANTNIGVLIEGSDTVSILNSEITGFARFGATVPSAEILVVGYGTYQTSGCVTTDNITVANNILHGASPSSQDANGVYGFGCGPNILHAHYYGNHVYNMGGDGNTNASLSPNGLTCNGVKSCLIEHNLIHDIGWNQATCGGPTGITLSNGSGTLQFNEVYNVRPSAPAGCDFDGLDLDISAGNSIVQYNYAHNNAGNCILNFANNGNNTIRYNICENNDSFRANGAEITIQPSGGPVLVYNNTIFENGSDTAHTNPPACFSFGYSGSHAVGTLIANNICENSRGDQFGQVYGIGDTPNNAVDTTNITFTHNLYFLGGGGSAGTMLWDYSGTDVTTPTRDVSPVLADPKLVNPGNGGTCGASTLTTGPQPCPSAYGLQTGSPALGAGITISNDGSRDYYGNPLTTPRNIGAQ